MTTRKTPPEDTNVAVVDNVNEPNDSVAVDAEPEFDQHPDIGMPIRGLRVDPERQAVQRAAMLQAQAAREPGKWTPIGNGEMVAIEPYITHKYPGIDTIEMLSKPHEILLNPKPAFFDQYGMEMGPRYMWFVRTSPNPRDTRPNKTAALHRSGRIRYIEVSEVDPMCDKAVYAEFVTPNNKYVTYDDLILGEIKDPVLAYEKKKTWEDLGISRSANLEQEVTAYPDARVGNKAAAHVKRSNIRTGG